MNSLHTAGLWGESTLPPGRGGGGECTAGMARGICVGTLGAWLNKCVSCLIKNLNYVALKVVVFFFKIEYLLMIEETWLVLVKSSCVANISPIQ